MEYRTVTKALKAMGVPPLVYGWDISELDDATYKATIINKIPDVLSFVKQRQHLLLVEEVDPLLASRVSVFMLGYMLSKDYTNVGYLTPEKLATLRADSWEGGEEYTRYIQMDFVVIDRVYPTELDKFKLASVMSFFEYRLLNKKSVVLVTDSSFIGILSPRISSAIKASDVKKIERKKC